MKIAVNLKTVKIILNLPIDLKWSDQRVGFRHPCSMHVIVDSKVHGLIKLRLELSVRLELALRVEATYSSTSH